MIIMQMMIMMRMMMMMMMMITNQEWLRASMQGCHSQEVPESELLIRTRMSKGKDETRVKKHLLDNVLKAATKNQPALKKECIHINQGHSGL